jgi:hypothetical protein
MKNNKELYAQAERYRSEYGHMRDEINFALELLTEEDAPNRISREERIGFAILRLTQAQRYFNGEGERTVWPC